MTSMSTQPPPGPPEGAAAQNGPPMLSTITSLPPLPNPLHPRGSANTAAESMRVLRTLGENASSGAVDYPYPTNTDYPLPPLPPIPIPTGTARRRRAEPQSPAQAPISLPPIPVHSYLAGAHTLDSALKAHNDAHPDIPVAVHYGRSALLVRLREKGWLWVLVRTLGGEGDVKVLGVRSFLSRDARPPPIHTVSPPGPSVCFGEHLMSLSLTLTALLYRLPHEVELIYTPCYRCGKHISDIDGLPLNASGWIPPSPRRNSEKVANGKADDAMDVDEEEKAEKKDGENDEKEGEKVGKDGEKAESEESKPEPEEQEKDGRWVAWHASCRSP